MAKQRYMNTAFWTDDYIGELSPDEKLIYVCLFTNPDTNVAGIYEISYHSLKSYTGLTKEQLIKALERFENDRKVYYRNGWLIVCNMPKHQEYEKKPKIKAGIINFLTHSVPNDLLQLIIKEKIPYTYPIDTLSIEYKYPIDTLRDDSDSDSDLDSDSDSDSNECVHNQKGETHIPSVPSAVSFDLDVQNLWIATFGINPNLKPQQDFARKLLDTFGHEKAKSIMYEFAKKGFKIVDTMENALDWKTGLIKPRDRPNSKEILDEYEVIQYCRKNKINITYSGDKLTGVSDEFNRIFKRVGNSGNTSYKLLRQN